MTPPDHPPPLPEPDPPPLPADEVIELVPEPVPVVRPVRRRYRPEPPQPGFLMAIAVCVGLLISLYVPLVIAGGLTFAVLAFSSGDAKTFWQGEKQQMQKVVGAGQAKPSGDPPSMPDGISYSLAAGMAAGHVGSLTLTLLLLRFGVGPEWKRKVALRRPPIVPLVLSLLVLPGLMLTHAAVHTGLHEMAEAVMRLVDPKADLGSGSMDAQLKAMLSPWPVWLAVLIIGIGPGVIEEFFCRGYLGRGLVARYGLVGGVMLTSMLFGMLHLAPLYAVGTMVMGGAAARHLPGHAIAVGASALALPQQHAHGPRRTRCADGTRPGSRADRGACGRIPARVRVDRHGPVGALVGARAASITGS
jgi:CAAX protease family protein